MPRSAFPMQMVSALRLSGISALAAWVVCAGCTATGNAPQPAVAKRPEVPGQRRITVLTTSESDQKYCNGERMDSDGYRRTLTRETPLTLPSSGKTLDAVRAVLDATTTGMCNTVMKQLDFHVEQGELHIPPIDAWAGVSIVMCHCEPEVELNLPRIPGIARVVWDAASEGASHSDETDLHDAMRQFREAFTQHDLRRLDGFVSGKIGLFVTFPVGISYGTEPFDSFTTALAPGRDGTSYFDHITLSCDFDSPGAKQAAEYSERPDPCSDDEPTHLCAVGTPHGFSFETLLERSLENSMGIGQERLLERARLADGVNERFVYDASQPLGVFWGKIDGRWAVLGLDLWDCSI